MSKSSPALRRAVRAALLGALLLAAGCSGGSDSSPPPPPAPPVNQAPTFTSSASAATSENTSGTIYVATAADPEGGSLAFSLSGGADAGRFSFNAATRELRFLTAPDFENPTDANRDNVYEIQISVTDGSASSNLLVRITVADAVGGFRVRRVAQGLAAPIFATGIPDGSGRVAVVERGGRIRVLNPATGAIASQDLLNISTEVSQEGERGLLAMAFSPTFETDRLFYIHVNNTRGDTEIRRYRMLGNASDIADSASADLILAIDQPDQFTNHKGGMLVFDLAGNLLIGMGDGGGGGDPLGNAQNANTLLGKLLRIDPRSDAFPSDPNRDYAIPPGNAFPGGAGGLAEIQALGLRNPFRGSVDPVSGDVFIGDVGQNAVEEIDRIASGATGQINFGWPLREGSQPYNGGANSSAFTPPVADYSHGSGVREGRSVTGGVVYRGPAESLQGQYLFADFITNNLWSLPASSLVVGQTTPSSQFTIRTQDFAPDVGTIATVVAFGVDATGQVYIVDIGGEIFRIEASN